MTYVKICGLRDEEGVDAAVAAGADWVGFVLEPTSPRYVPFERAGALAAGAEAAGVAPWIVAVGLSEDHLWRMRDWPVADLHVQFHGHEHPEYLEEARTILLNRTIVKAMGVAQRKDLEAAADFTAADMLLLDAKPPRGSDRTGGHGEPFKWSILKSWTAPKPWVLSGGLNADTVAKAIRTTGARAVDVSSGVESAPGVKDPVKIRDFVQAAKDAAAQAA